MPILAQQFGFDKRKKKGWLKKKRAKSRTKFKQPCWTCKKACGRCSWSFDGTPVDGWEAVRHRIPENKKFADTYKILECPEYELYREEES